MSYFNTRAFAAYIKAKRGKRGLREVAEEIEGVSISTLSRLEREGIPDMPTFLAVLDWLDAEPDEFMMVPMRQAKPAKGPMEHIEHVLLNHTRMTPDTIAAIMAILHIAQRDAENDGGKDDRSRH